MNTIETEISKRPVFKPSAETEKVINHMRQTQVGEVITWQTLHALASTANRQKLTGCLTTARKHLLNEDKAVFAAVRGVGLKRLDNVEVVQQEGTTAIKVRRAVSKSMRRLSTVDPEGLDNGSKLQYRATSAALGAIHLCVKPSTLGKVKQLVIDNGKIEAGNVLDLFRK
jgi:hypothetical protein